MSAVFHFFYEDVELEVFSVTTRFSFLKSVKLRDFDVTPLFSTLSCINTIVHTISVNDDVGIFIFGI